MVQTFVKRPTSPLTFEPLETPQVDVLWPGSDEEADEDERENKRIRIERIGKQYLDGRPLFIQSAGLRGPLNRGWVNPWARKKRGHQGSNQKPVYGPKPAEWGSSRQAEGETFQPRNKRRSMTDAAVGSSTEGRGSVRISEDHKIKRRRLEEAARPVWGHAQGHPTVTFPEVESQSCGAEGPFGGKEAGSRDPWLKTDLKFLQSRSNDEGPSSTPTPVVRPRNRSEAKEILAPKREHPSTVLVLPENQEDEARQSEFVQATEPFYLHKHALSRNSEEPQQLNTGYPTEPVLGNAARNASHQDSRAHVRAISLSDRDPYTKDGHAAVKRLSQEAVARPNDGRYDSSKLSQDAVSGTSRSAEKPTSSRLKPYVSDFDIKDDAATSAGLRTVKRARTPKPSTHAAPASTNLPQFKYRYASKGSPTHAFKTMRSLAKAPRGALLKRRSESTSSSGSSDFVKEFEAAQAKANSRSLGSSFSSSPIKERHETTSVKKNTQAMRKLTFTASGEPRIAESHQSSRPSSILSAVVPSAPSPKRGTIRSKVTGKNGAVKKSSDMSLTNATISHGSFVLPEAQVVSDALVQPVQLPSGPSTNLLETDKQSPKFISINDEDSYFGLSTQAAMQKAQRSFKEDNLSPVKINVPDSRDRRPEISKSIRAIMTPANNGRPARATDSNVIKPEPEDDAEPMSTQAMADAISPFAVTTVKKGPPAKNEGADVELTPTRAVSPGVHRISSPEPSPIDIFQKPLSMSTTPSTSQPHPSSQPKPTPPVPVSHPNTASKPHSTLTSFSILRNGTMTDTSSIFQDGQQSQPGEISTSLRFDAFSTPFATTNGNGKQPNGGWDLDAAIEEAGSFLGDWNVEAEARKEGNEKKKRAEEGKGILSAGKGNLGKVLDDVTI